MLRRQKPKGAIRRPPRTHTPPTTTLAPEWRVWIAENLLRGATRDVIARALASQGVSTEEIDRQIKDIESSPGFVAGRQFARQSRRLDSIAQLMTALARTAPHPTTVERRANVSADEFFDRYYATATPVVLTDVVTRWRALGLWSPEHFKSRYGEVEVQAAFGRAVDPDYDMHTAKLSRAVRFGDFIDRVLAAGESNDLYLVANNRNMDRAALQSLYEDVAVDAAVLDPARYAGSVALWFGPGGTVTPMHHDTSNILFAQVYGRKRFKLVAPWETALLAAARGVYCDIDPEAPDLAKHPAYAKVTVKDLTLAPGDMLFIPVGWWHHVRALDLSINIAFTNFTRNNAFDWYRPGEK